MYSLFTEYLVRFSDISKCDLRNLSTVYLLSLHVIFVQISRFVVSEEPKFLPCVSGFCLKFLVILDLLVWFISTHHFATIFGWTRYLSTVELPLNVEFVESLITEDKISWKMNFYFCFRLLRFREISTSFSYLILKKWDKFSSSQCQRLIILYKFLGYLSSNFFPSI